MKANTQQTTRKLPNDEVLLTGTTDLSFCKGKIIKASHMVLMLHHSGEGVVNINFKEYAIKPNTQVTLLLNATLTLVRASDDFQMSYLYFRPSELANLDLKTDPRIIGYIKNNPCYTHSPDKAAQLYGIMKLIQYYFTRHENCNRQTILRNLMQVFLLDNMAQLAINKSHQINYRSTRQEELFNAYINLLHAYSSTHREVCFYADKLCITPRYLTAITVRLTGGRSAKEILDEHVIAEVKRILYTPGTTIKDVVEQMCFPDQSFLGKYFKRQTGKTIREFLR